MQMQKELNFITVNSRKNQYCQAWEISPITPSLVFISSALNIVQTRPEDPAHSKYNDLSKQMHELLLQAILTLSAQKLYAAQLRHFSYPFGWARLQSPLHYLKSYSLSEHAWWSIIISGLLYCWLKESFIQPLFAQAVQKKFMQRPLSAIVFCFASVVKSNAVLMSDSLSTQDWHNLNHIIKSFRTNYQCLLEAVVNASNANPHSHSVTPNSWATTLTSTSTSVKSAAITQSVESGQSDLTISRTQRVKKYRNDKRQPNVHTVLHYQNMMTEYALLFNCNVLIEKNKHRYS